jgi:hypothetical protein
MADQTSFKLELYSPRWGREDVYEIELNREQMRILNRHNMETAVCSWVENGDPEWSGYESPANPLEGLLERDSIYPPSVFIGALESAWKAWRDGALSNEQIRSEIQELFHWVNLVTQNKPKTEFWRHKF